MVAAREVAVMAPADLGLVGVEVRAPGRVAVTGGRVVAALVAVVALTAAAEVMGVVAAEEVAKGVVYVHTRYATPQ